MTSPFLSFHGIAKTYNPGRHAVEAIRRFDLDVMPGEFVSVLGPSGCGKSTLLAMVAGLDAPSAGEIRLGGVPVRGPRFANGIVFQDATLLPWRSVLENTLLPIRIKKLDRRAYEPRARALLTTVGLGECVDRRPRQLSGGMRQRVAICRALIHDPDLLLMDEPFSALDAITRDEMAELMLTLWESVHKTALFITHSIREAVLLSDRVVVMSARPATAILDVTVPFPRPRSFALTETVEFNALCARLRHAIQASTRPAERAA